MLGSKGGKGWMGHLPLKILNFLYLYRKNTRNMLRPPGKRIYILIYRYVPQTPPTHPLEKFPRSAPDNDTDLRQ